MLLAGLAVAVGAAAVCLLSLAAAGGALAASHGAARAGYGGLRQVVVEPGQTLWSIASAAEPTADPRLVIQQIMEVNSLAGGTLQAGEVLWVPRA
jgi:LysM domain